MYRKSAYILFLAVLGLLVIGIVMLFSTSAFARDSHGDVYFFIRRQAVWFAIGLAVCTLAALTDYHFWQRTWWLWFALALIALALCYFPHVGMRLNGSRRWVSLGPITFQPSELAKLSAIVFLAAWFARRDEIRSNVLFGLVLPLAIISVPAGLVLGEVDLGTFASLTRALSSGDPADFEEIVVSGASKLVNPQAGLAFAMQGPDSHSLTMKPAPAFSSAEEAGDIAENYWMALTRDVPFSDYSTHALTQQAAADLTRFSDFREKEARL